MKRLEGKKEYTAFLELNGTVLDVRGIALLFN